MSIVASFFKESRVDSMKFSFNYLLSINIYFVFQNGKRVTDKNIHKFGMECHNHEMCACE